MRRGAWAAAGAAALVAATTASRSRAARSGAPRLARWEGRLATWVPPRPAAGLPRVAARAWAAPMTLLGLLVGATTGAVPRLREGVVLFAPAGGLAGRVVRRRGFAATGLGHVVVSVTDPSPGLWAHELVHVRQAERLGPFMIPVYLGLLARHGYDRHPMEMAARLGAAALSRRAA